MGKQINVKKSYIKCEVLSKHAVFEVFSSCRSRMSHIPSVFIEFPTENSVNSLCFQLFLLSSIVNYTGAILV
jgi:hypothetical protein